MDCIHHILGKLCLWNTTLLNNSSTSYEKQPALSMNYGTKLRPIIWNCPYRFFVLLLLLIKVNGHSYRNKIGLELIWSNNCLNGRLCLNKESRNIFSNVISIVIVNSTKSAKQFQQCINAVSKKYTPSFEKLTLAKLLDLSGITYALQQAPRDSS